MAGQPLSFTEGGFFGGDGMAKRVEDDVRKAEEHVLDEPQEGSSSGGSSIVYDAGDVVDGFGFPNLVAVGIRGIVIQKSVPSFDPGRFCIFLNLLRRSLRLIGTGASTYEAEMQKKILSFAYLPKNVQNDCAELIEVISGKSSIDANKGIEEIFAFLVSKWESDIIPHMQERDRKNWELVREDQRELEEEKARKEKSSKNHFEHLEEFAEEVAEKHRELRDRYQKLLDQIEGVTYETIEQRREIAERINRIASEIGCRFRCTTCSEPAKFRWSISGRSKLGHFSFEHLNRTTHRVGSTIPKLVLVDPLPDRRREKKSEKGS